MTAKPKVLVCFCCQGGEAMGYHRSGFEVEGSDLYPQPRFPFKFTQADAIDYVASEGHRFDLIVGGPPCQRYTKAQRIRGNEHPDLIGKFRGALLATGKPYVIENVEEARAQLRDPILVCGAAFEYRTYRHRLFESNVPLVAPDHPGHTQPTVKMGRSLKDGDFYHAVGNFSNVDYVRRDMGVEWMNRDGIRECIPPAYAEYIGRQIVQVL